MKNDEEAVQALLQHLDHPMSRVDAHTIMDRARPQRWSGIGRAAGVLLMLGLGGVAWAASGAPLPRWVAKAAALFGERSNSKPAAVAPAPSPSAAAESVAPTTPRYAGIAVAPGSQLIVSFTASQNAGELRVSLADVPDVSVRTEVGAATFTSSDGRLVIANAGSQASFTIELPVGAPRVEIVVNGRRRFLKNGARVSSETATRLGDVYVVSLKPLLRDKP